MANFSHYPLQSAIHAALTGNSPLMALISGVYDRPPQGTAYPYVTLGAMTGVDWSTKTTKGMEYSITLHVWSQQGGRKEVAVIMESLYAVLHQASLSVTGQTLVMMRFISSEINEQSDGYTYEGIMKFAAFLESD